MVVHRTRARDVVCVHCGAQPGEDCVQIDTPRGYHQVRINHAGGLTASANARARRAARR